MNLCQVIDLLVRENPKADASSVRIYADAFCTYAEATENIATNGAIVIHPRTGSPIENPYLKIRTQAQGVLRKASRLKTSEVWALIAPM